ASDVATDKVSVSVVKGDSVTFHTNATMNQQERFKWYFTKDLIARIGGDLNNICTDVKCNNDTERFRDRLKLDHLSGDLIITNISTSDKGDYRLQTFSSKHIGKTFTLDVNDAPAEIKRKTVMEGESVTLDAPKVRNLSDSVTWIFNGTRIAEISGELTKICEDVQCKKRFRHRLKLDNQTGSLLITNTKSTDHGLYQLLTKSRRNHYSTTSIKSFTVSVTRNVKKNDSGLSSGFVAGVCVVAVVLLVIAAVVAGVIYYCQRRYRKGQEIPRNRRGSRQDLI
ncbi:hypothetical protein QQF64_019941, partial [Cirrhinus molitorella]